MAEMEDITVNRNASFSEFGWEFQTNAAIVLFIRNIEDASSVRVEGAHEDIEITLYDGTVIYAQAKARAGNEPGKGSTDRLDGALKTMADDICQGDYRELVYVTNDDYPFGKSHDVTDLHGGGTLSFSELSDAVQDFIKEKARVHGIEGDALQAMSVSVIGFYGNDRDTRYKHVRAAIRDMLERLNLARHADVNDGSLRDQWGTMMRENAGTQNTEITVTKEDFVWPVIVMLCKVDSDDKSFEDYDEEDVQDIVREYESTVNYYTQKFEFVTKVSTDFDEFLANNTGKRSELRRRFIDAQWGSYTDILGLNEVSDGETRSIVAKLVMRKVLRRKDVIKMVKDGVNLGN